MSPTITRLEEIDYELSVAYIALGIARTSWRHCPSAENARSVAQAEADVDRLLDERNARRPPAWA